MAARGLGLMAIFRQGHKKRSSFSLGSVWAGAEKSRCLAVDTNAPPGQSRQGDYNEQEDDLKEDFIATPLPEVPQELREDPKKFPHQSDEERKADMDVMDEGEAIPKTPGYIPHHDPNASPDLKKRSYHTGRLLAGFSPLPSTGLASARGLHTSAAFARHPMDKHVEDLKSPRTDDDPTLGTLGGDKSYMNLEVEDDAVRDSSRLSEPAKLHERRRAKDPEYYDRVHPGNPGQKADEATRRAALNQHASRREADKSTFSSDADKAPTEKRA